MMVRRAAATGLLGWTNVFAVLRLLPMSNRDKDVEILACAIRSPYWSASSARRRCGSTRLIGRSWRRCCTGCRATCCARCGCWCVRIRCCAGTATRSPAATRPGPGPSARAGRGPCAPSAPWPYAWRGRTPAGGTAESTANCWFWG
ncbi:hypothetical protein DKT69_10975 [Micromonospora sicca]|uniref:Uncharacterized protein n=1 Tax=Micromonospora sicca TaxID=2202420 RepID=A0A317DRM6_9ACTN|nr:hypothetical protein DKT69_10975 [Micromonospora sp. 4G51]